MSRATAQRLWQQVHDQPFAESDWAEVEPTPETRCPTCGERGRCDHEWSGR